jgi:predicted MFS family arabinose efflux permease
VTPRVATYLMFVVNGGAVGTWIASIPGIQDSLGLSGTEMGTILLIAAFGALVAQQVTGQLLVRMSSRRLLAITGLAFPLLVVLPLLAPSFLALALVMFVFGAFNTSMDTTMNHHGVALEDRGGKSILSGLHAGWSIGGVLAAAAVAGALALGVDPIIEATAASVVLFVVAFTASRFLGTGSTRTPNLSRGIHWPSRAVIPVALLVILIAVVEGGLADWGGIYLRDGTGADEGTAALAYAALSLGLFIGRVGGDRVKDRIGSIRLIEYGLLLTAAVVTLFLVVGDSTLGLVGMVIAGIGVANTIPQLFGAAGRIPPTGPSLAATFTSLTIAFMISPLIIGTASDAIGISSALGLVVVCSLVAALFVRRVPLAETNPRFARAA